MSGTASGEIDIAARQPFERGLGPRNPGGRFGRGVEPPSEGKQRFQRKPIVLPIILEV